jgi:long-subunit fatty acid transport protein
VPRSVLAYRGPKLAMYRAGALFVVLSAALAAALSVRPAHAGGFGIPEIGVRRTAMGSIIGRPDDPSAIYHNPAGLVLQHGWQLYGSFGLSLLDTEFRLAPWDQSEHFLGVSPEGDGYFAAVKPSRALGVIPMLAATAEILPGRLVLGAAVYVGNATGAAFEEAAVTRYHLIDGYVVAPQAVLAAAYRISDALSVGVSAGVINLRVHGKRDVFPILKNADGSTYDASALVGTRPELVLDGTGWAPTWMIAAFGRPVPRVTWGATLTGRVDATLSGPVVITCSDGAKCLDGNETSDGRYQVTGTQTTNQLLPWAFMAGANVDVTPNVELGGELRYWLYRQYKSQHTDIEHILLIQQLDTTKNYHDSWEVSGGLRVHDLAAAPSLELMAGTQYDRSPAPPRTVTLDQPSFSHWGLHSGLRYQVGRYRLGASYIHYWYAVPTITDSITAPPSNIRGSGANNIVTASIEVKL